MKYIDPTGHMICDSDGECHVRYTLEGVLDTYGVELLEESAKWSSSERIAVLDAVVAVAIRMGVTTKTSSVGAFRYEYGTNSENPLQFVKVSSYKYRGLVFDAGCLASNSHLIQVAKLSQATTNRPDSLAMNLNINNFVHELGHAFVQHWWGNKPDTKSPYSKIKGKLLSEAGWPTIIPGAENLWRQGEGTSGNEIFADMFLGWTFNVWGGEDLHRNDFMISNMAGWLTH